MSIQWPPLKPSFSTGAHIDWSFNSTLQIITLGEFDSWWKEHIEPLGPGIKTRGYIVKGCHIFDQSGTLYDSHRAILIGIEPIKKQSAEDLLKDLISAAYSREPFELKNAVARAQEYFKDQK